MRFIFALAALSYFAVPFAGAAVRETDSFDHDWRFVKSDARGAEAPSFDDSTWTALDVPHDWSIAGPVDPSNPAGGAGAFMPAGVGWYRKRFTLPASDAGRRVFIDFDGVMANSDVWVNGALLGRRPYGYVSFRYELTGHLTFGDDRPNVIAVRCDDAAQPASRWYAGAGIYRHVRLVVTDPVHLEQWGTFVTTPRVGKADADVHVRNTVANQSDAPRRVSVRVALLDPDGQAVASAESEPRTVAPGKSVDFDQDLPRVKARLWDVDHPNLYRAVSEVRSSDGKTLDDDATPFGIRTATFEPDTGFWLNGVNLKIKGVCLHGDAGALGVAVPLAAWERRLGALKALGVNAIRTAHNPPAPEFLDLCDRMGFLVMDEMFDCWTVAKNPYDYHLYFKEWSLTDTRDTVRRDRNHPSVVLYSAGNEIHDTPNAALSKQILASLIDTFHKEDPTRPVTQALFRPNVSHDYDDGLADLLDVVGTNYRFAELLAAHDAKPTRKIIGTENGKDLKGWAAVRDNAPYSGEFLWTGADYLGESRRWPAIGNPAGLIDTTGVPHPVGHQFQSWWSDKPMVYVTRDEGSVRTGNQAGEPQTRRVLASDWTPRDVTGAKVENVEVYSNCEQVELTLNGKSLGTQDRPDTLAPRAWKIPFEPGELKAEGKNGGQVVATHALRTAGKAVKILLSTDRPTLSPSWDDVAYVEAQWVDEKGVLVPAATGLVTFTLDGPGKIVAVDNGDLTSHEPFQSSARHAFGGRCVAVVRASAPGSPVKVSASAPGLEASSVTIDVTNPR